MLLRHLRLDIPDLEHAFLARIGRRFDEDEKTARDQDDAHDLQNSHVTPLQGLSKRFDAPRCCLALAQSSAGGPVEAVSAAVTVNIKIPSSNSSRTDARKLRAA